jgi:intraflagellar transport protein 172
VQVKLMALWIAHLCAGKIAAAKRGDTVANRKLAIACLKYVWLIPADKAFHEAGMACKNAGDVDMAFVLLNRFLDIAEAVEEHEASSTVLDNSDFAHTEVPRDFTLPEESFIDEAGREQVRDFVLELSMNSKVKQVLDGAELGSIFRELDQVRDALRRGESRAPAGAEQVFVAMREVVDQVN